MIKLHEIPLYALSVEQLTSRYERFKENFWKNCSQLDQETFQKCVEHETFPQRCWTHNHIVGYIDILLDMQDIVFEIYLPHPQFKRYDWRRSRKIYMRNIMANGTHFRIESRMKNSDIQTQIFEMLDGIIKNHIHSKYYVDRNVFDMIHYHIDYKGIYENQRKSGEIL